MRESLNIKGEETVSLEKETGITDVILNKINNNPKLKKAFLALVMSVGLLGPINTRAQTMENKSNPKNKMELGFEDNYILQEDIRGWVNLIKTGILVEKGEGYFVSATTIHELIDKYGTGEEYGKALEEKRNEFKLANEKIDADFLRNTSAVSEEEIKKVYEYLKLRMNVWNLSDLAAFAHNLDLISKLINKNDPRMADGYYSEGQLDNVRVSANTYVYGDGGRYNERQDKNDEEEAVMLYHAIKNLIK